MYNCIVSKISEIKKHSNADRLQLADVLGYQVIVGLDAKEGDIILLFPDDGQLSEEYAKANDLVEYKDENGERRGGYFDHRRKVKVQKFRGEKSEAYVAPLSSLEFTGFDIFKLSVGDKFNELNNIPICNKYITKATKQASQGNNKKTKKEQYSPQRNRKYPFWN